MKPTRILLPALIAVAIALTAAAPHHDTSVGAHDNDSTNLRLLYWNIQNAMWSGQCDGYRDFLEFVKEQNPDICVWAEASTNYRTASAERITDDAERHFPAHWEEFAARYGHPYVYKGGHRDNFPQVITSRYPIENVERITGNADTVVSHGAGWATICKNGHNVNIVTLHTWPQRYAWNVGKDARKADAAANGGDRYRRTEMEYICRHTISTRPGADTQLWMMMGDFNAISRLDNRFYRLPADTSAFLCHDYVLETTPYIDVISKKYPDSLVSTIHGAKRIDYLYCTPPLYNCITRAEVIRDDYTTPRRDPQKLSNFWHPSDHCPILVDFDLSRLD
ncbi:endonuclease/exonuclease/phosphatase family protein [uncultured Muribaculum sp.]|uniref:endonuclease/exonuclease/phosphatase family protein n=1 Tax=uncultured Muribaculum sp. TaxID=1918613 RepID=UPI0025E7D239|nr:endonuclease/exonuclease/phosphatase family protein [uncultured Muribaculum sp.]